MRYLIIIYTLLCSFCVTAESRSVKPYQANQPYYVWATNGLNLRKAPAEKGSIVVLLPYGTQVEILEQQTPLTPYQLIYTSNVYVKSAMSKITLNGDWIKVKAGSYEGFVFNRLLLPHSPINKGEQFNDYLRRVFNLSLTSNKVEQYKVDEYSYPLTEIKTIKIFTDKQQQTKMQLTEARSESEEKTKYSNSTNIFISNMNFEDAFIFFNIIKSSHSVTLIKKEDSVFAEWSDDKYY